MTPELKVITSQMPGTVSPVILQHLRRLTDDTGLLEHATGSIPNPTDGYTVDDNARGIIACCYYRLVSGKQHADVLADRYLQFLLYCQRKDGRMHNNVSYDRRFEDQVGSEDSHGRTAWAVGYASTFPWREDIRSAVWLLRDRLRPWLLKLRAPRALAYTLLGVAAVHGSLPLTDAGYRLTCQMAPTAARQPDRWRDLARQLAPRLVRSFAQRHGWDGMWITPRLTYDDGRMVEAVLRVSELFDVAEKEQWKQVGLSAAEFLWNTVWSPQRQCVILPGNHWMRGQKREQADEERSGKLIPYHFDQQPLDAAALVDMCLAAYRVTRQQSWLRRAQLAMEWFYGRNITGISLAVPETGACYDGLTPDGPNLNQGAESTLAHLMAYLAVASAQ